MSKCIYEDKTFRCCRCDKPYLDEFSDRKCRPNIHQEIKARFRRKKRKKKVIAKQHWPEDESFWTWITVQQLSRVL